MTMANEETVARDGRLSGITGIKQSVTQGFRKGLKWHILVWTERKDGPPVAVIGSGIWSTQGTEVGREGSYLRALTQISGQSSGIVARL
jgi:hypothetical protein